MIYKLKMGSDTVCYIKSDLKNKFSYFKFEKDTVFQRNKADKNNNLVFILHGEMEVIYGDLYPSLFPWKLILLTPFPDVYVKPYRRSNSLFWGSAL